MTDARAREMVANLASGAPAASVRAAHGAVQGVRDYPSRETTVILIEIPEEHHVQATLIFHGQHALIVQSVTPGSAYGIINVAAAGDGPRSPFATLSTEMSGRQAAGVAEEHSDAAAMPTFVHARVRIVRPVQSRMVTAIELEVPNVYHREITSLLHGRDALVLPVNLPPAVPFGILTMDSLATTGLPALGGDPGARTKAPTDKARGGFGDAPEFTRGAAKITKWLGARCQEEAFQEFLNVRTEAAAITEVRARCGVESRAEIARSEEATRLFMSTIYGPYEAHKHHKQAHKQDHEHGHERRPKPKPTPDAPPAPTPATQARAVESAASPPFAQLLNRRPAADTRRGPRPAAGLIDPEPAGATCRGPGGCP